MVFLNKIKHVGDQRALRQGTKTHRHKRNDLLNKLMYYTTDIWGLFKWNPFSNFSGERSRGHRRHSPGALRQASYSCIPSAENSLSWPGHQLSWLKFSCSSSVPPVKCMDSTSIRPWLLPSKSSSIHHFISHPTIWCYVASILKALIK
jgi:hypothetical protein